MKISLVASGVGMSLCLLALTGCAGNKVTTADLMRQDATAGQTHVDLKQQIARDWEKGQKLIATGEKRIKEGEKQVKSAERDLERAHDEIERGEREIAEGKKLIRESEKTFREDYPEVDLNYAD